MFGHDKDENDNQNNQGVPLVPQVPDDALNDMTTTPAPAPAAAPAAADDNQPSAPPVSTADDTYAPAADDGLLNIKRQALQQLQPLVGHLEQSPEEKFKTTMMMIQAADDKTLVETAYAAAQQITDEKAKAQALLDVINEINYFTHPQS